MECVRQKYFITLVTPPFCKFDCLIHIFFTITILLIDTSKEGDIGHQIFLLSLQSFFTCLFIRALQPYHFRTIQWHKKYRMPCKIPSNYWEQIVVVFCQGISDSVIQEYLEKSNKPHQRTGEIISNN